MRIFNDKNVEIKSPNLRKGRLEQEKRLVKHHKAVEAVEEKWHYEVVAEDPNGGKDVKRVVDVPAVEAKEAYDEYEDILRYVEYTAEELSDMRKAPLSTEAKLMLFAESIEEDPYPDAQPTTGYMYQRMYSADSGKIVWTLVPDPDNPIEFLAGTNVVKGLYYTNGKDVFQCIQNGVTKSLNNTTYFKKQQEESN